MKSTDFVDSQSLRSDIPDFGPGDELKVHVKVVERTIGAKKGTGGSPGVEFLKKSLFQPVFADLWAIRHEL